MAFEAQQKLISKNIPALTGIRGVAALWVALYHGVGQLALGSLFAGWAMNMIGSGWLAVDLFFVLSGFIMTYVHGQDFERFTGEQYARFLRLRIARIYPAHLVAALCWLPLLLGAHGSGVSEQMNGRTFFAAVTLLNGWGLPHVQGWNLPSWSVGSEWFAYLAFPALYFVIRGFRSVRAYVLAAVATLVITTGLALALNPRQYMLPESYTLLRVTSEFFLGCCMCGVYRRWKVPGLIATASILGIVLLSCFGVAGIWEVLYIVLFAALVLSLAGAQNVAVKVLGSRVLVFLGQISFSLYLIHSLVIVAMRQLPRFHVELPTAARLAVYLVLIVLAGWLLYSTVEVRARDLLRRRWRISSRVPASVHAATD